MSMNLRYERGFTLIELLVSMMITTVVLGGALLMSSQVQESFRHQIEDSAGEQEGRYALEWVSRLIRAAGNNTYSLPLMNDNGTPADLSDDIAIPPECPAGNLAYSWVIMNPDGLNGNDDIRLQTDSNPPDGILGGTAGDCNQANEDVTVAYDAATSSITFLDNNIGGAGTVRTDAVINGLNFVFKDVNHVPTANAANVVYVETQITVRTRTISPITLLPETRLLTQEVRLRGRNY
jgi:prepilin-type N-terminal cleavage/methylation domain-containing protein